MCSGLIGRSGAIASRMACILAVALLVCASSAHGQVVEEDGFPVKGGNNSGESFSLSCPPRPVAQAGESVLLSCTATGVPEEGVRYGWESLSGDGLHLLSASDELSPLFTAPVSGVSSEYAYRLTAMAVGIYRTAPVTVSVEENISGESSGVTVVQEDCDPFAVPEGLGESCLEGKAPVPFGFGAEEEGGFLFPEAPGLPDRPAGPVRGGGSGREAPPRLECPLAVFLEELETGSIECHAWDAAGEEYLEYSWEPVGSTTRDYLENPRLLPEDAPNPSVVAPEAPRYDTLESFLSGDRALRYRYRLTATSRLTGLSSREEVEVFVSSSRPSVYCPLEIVVEEGDTVTLDCEGVDPLSFRMAYDEEAASVLWEWEGLWGTSTAPLSAKDLSSPLFTAPLGSAGEEYHYIASMTSSASGVPRTARRRVTVRVIDAEEEAQAAADDSALMFKGSVPVVTCEDAEVYEATADFTLDCEAQDVPTGATYNWTGTDIDNRLIGTTILTPDFMVPNEVGGKDKDYDYTVTMTAGGVVQASEDVTVTVLDKKLINCTQWNGGVNNLSGRLRGGSIWHFDPCLGAFTGAPEGSEYVFTWTGLATACCSEEEELSRLSRTDIEDPVFTAPTAAPYSSIMYYTYTFEVSAKNADPRIRSRLGVSLFVRNRPQLSITCSGDSYEVDAGTPNFPLECSPSGAWSSGFPYMWQWSPTDNLTGHNTGMPTFRVPASVDEDTPYTYTARVSATDHISAQTTVAVTVLSTNPSIACTNPAPVYEGDPGFLLTCTPRRAPENASYSWSSPGAPADTSVLSATDALTPTFEVPKNVDADTDYSYTVTMSASGVDVASAFVTVTVLNKTDLSVLCIDYTFDVQEGDPNFRFDCIGFNAPAGTRYVWTPRGNTPNVALLRNADQSRAVFKLASLDVPRDSTFEYTLTASASEAIYNDGTAEVSVTVRNKSVLSVACTNADTEVYEGADDFALGCTPSGAPGDNPQYTYAWTGDAAALALLDEDDIASPTFAVPDTASSDKTYEYTLTVSAQNADAATVDVEVTVLNKKALVVACTNVDTEVYEGSEDFALGCTPSGAPGDNPVYTYAWTGDAAALALLDEDDIASPTFAVPDTASSDKTYEYRLTVSAQNADAATVDVEVTVLNKKALVVACTNADTEVYEGSEDFALGCTPSGAPGDNPVYTYAWTGDAAALALLDEDDIASPTFAVPDTASSDKTYEYRLTVSAQNADDATVDVEVTVLNKKALVVACTNADTEVYEGSEDFALGCTPSGAPGDNPVYTYAWTGDAAALALLDNDDIAFPTFAVPDTASSDKTYEYTLTVSAQNADAAAVDVEVTVLNKKALVVFCAVPASVFEGSDDVLFNCDASGAPGIDPAYTYAWTGEAAALALLDADDIASPTFAVPPAVDEDKTYEYTLTVSAENADTRSIEVTLKVLDAGALALACTIPLSVYEGLDDVLFDCGASGAPSEDPQYTYAWTGDAAALALLDADDIASPTFYVPDEVPSDETYEYTLTVSARDAEDARLDVAITVLNKRALAVMCADPGSVYEGSADIMLDCTASGAPGDDPEYAYVWTPRGDAQDGGGGVLLSATDIASPVFYVPGEVAATTTYEYLLTASAENAEDTTLDVAITVLNKGTLAVACADPGSVYEGSDDVELDCTASGAPGDDPQYTYAWTGDAAALALLDADDIASPTFSVPVEVSGDETYEYTLTVSARNAEDARLDVAITVLNKGALAVVCTNAFAEVYEGADDFVLDCTASGAPGDDPQYTYAWTGDAAALALLDANDIASPTFSVPGEVSSDETYEYTLTVSAGDAEDARLDVAITVLNKGTLAVVCTNAFAEVYEGADDFELDCTASGAPGDDPQYTYAWTARGSTLDTSLLSAADIASPVFYVPDEVDATTTYEYLLTASADNAEDATTEVSVTVLNERALAVACADRPSVYEGAEDFDLGCSASGGLAGSTYEYVWTARGSTPDVSLLSAADVASPVFYVPDEVDEDETYEYLLTVSAQNAKDARADVTVTVLNKEALALTCAAPPSAYEGSDDIAFDCEASGAPAGSAYAYAWTASGDTQDTALLSAADIASPVFYVPDEVDEDKTYEYLLTASAQNADDATVEVTVTVLNKGALALVCTHVYELYEGSEDFALDCSASGAPEGSAYAYAWTARGDTQDTSLLSATDIASPVFYVPEEVDATTTYEYLLTASADNAEDATTEVSVTVLNKRVLVVTCADPPSVYEGAEDFDLDCSASGGLAGSTYEYVWTARGSTPDVSLLSAADVASPVFYVPDEVDEDETYEYLLTVSAQNAKDATAEITVTVLNKSALAVACADPPSVYEGSDNIAFDCEASGAPAGSAYEYVWTPRGDTQDTALLSAADIASPVFYVPDVVDQETAYEYLLTVSAANADNATAEVTVTVLNKGALALACTHVYELYEGSEDFALDCSASGAPEGSAYAYAWTAQGDTQDTSLLSATDISSPTFHVPDDLDETTTYEYLLTASAENSEPGSAQAEVAVTVVHPAPLAFADDSIAGRVYVFTVGETIADIVLPYAKGGLAPYAYTLALALLEGLALDGPARTISGTPLQVSPRTEYTWQVADANGDTVQLAFFIEVVPVAVPSPPVTESSSPEVAESLFPGVTTSVSPLRFGVQSADTQVVLDPMTDRITTNVAGPYHAGRMTLSVQDDEGPLAAAEEIALSVELVSPMLLRREGDDVESSTLVLSPSWSYTESCERLSSESLGGLYTELLLSEGDCPLLLFGGELDLADALPGRYEGVMDVILRWGDIEETRTLEVDVTVISARRMITIGPGGVRLDTSRELPAGLTENQNLSIYPDVAFLTAEKPHEVFELSNPSLIPLEVSVSARFGYVEATEEGREVIVENAADSDLGDLSSLVDIHPSVLVLQPGEKGLVRYGIREEVLSSLSEKGYAAFFDVVSSPRLYADLDRMPEEVAGDRTARVTMRVPGVYLPGDGASRLQAKLLSISDGVSLSATFLVETLDGPFMGEVIAYDGEGRELGRRETLVYTRSRVRVPLSRKPDGETVFLRFAPRGAGRIPEPASIRWNAPPRDVGDASDKTRTRPPATLVQRP